MFPADGTHISGSRAGKTAQGGGGSTGLPGGEGGPAEGVGDPWRESGSGGHAPRGTCGKTQGGRERYPACFPVHSSIRMKSSAPSTLGKRSRASATRGPVSGNLWEKCVRTSLFTFACFATEAACFAVRWWYSSAFPSSSLENVASLMSRSASSASRTALLQ